MCLSRKIKEKIGGNVLRFHLFSLFLHCSHDGHEDMRPTMTKSNN